MIIIKNTYVLGLFVPTIIKVNNGIVAKIPGYRFQTEVDIKGGTEVIIKQGFTRSRVKLTVNNDSIITISTNRVLNVLFILAWMAFILLCFFGPSSTAGQSLKLSGPSFYFVLAFPILFLLSLAYYSYINPQKAIIV